MADVASLAGTSTAVVSYVVNNGPRAVAENTKARVLEAIETLDYRPNRTARALASNRSGMIGLVVPSSSVEFFVQVVEEIERSAFEADLLTIVGSTGFTTERERAYAQAFIGAGVDTLIVASTGGDELQAGPTDVLWLHHRPRDAAGSFAEIDNAGAGALAMDHLLAHEPKHVVVVSGPPTSNPSDAGPVGDRLAGCRRAIEASGRSWGSVQVVESPFDRASAMTAHDWTDLPSETGVVVLTDEQAVGVCAALGPRVGSEIAVVSIDGTTATQCLWPPVTSAVVPIADIAAWVVERCLAGDTTAHRQFDVTLRIGQSCGCRP